MARPEKSDFSLHGASLPRLEYMTAQPSIS